MPTCHFCRAELDSYLKTRQPASFLHSLKQRLVLAPQDAIMHGTRYNVPLLNALAFYVGIQVGFTTPTPAAKIPIKVAACQMGKSGNGHSEGYKMASM